VKNIINKILKLLSTNSVFVKNIILLIMFSRLFYVESEIGIKLFEAILVASSICIDGVELEDIT